MRRSTMLRVSSTRDICVFCAARQFAAANPTVEPQRRYLNSSNKAPQHASELLYKEPAAPAPARPLTQAEKMQQLLRSRTPQAPPSTPSPAVQQRSRLEAQFQRPQQPSDRRPGRTTTYQPPVRSKSQNIYGPMDNARGVPQRFNGPSDRQNRYNIKMDTRTAPNVEAPAFGTGQLRRRNEPRFPPAGATGASVPTPRSRPSQRLNQSEIDRLLGNNSKRESPRPYAPLSREATSTRKCMHCGRQDHTSLNCPSQPVLRPATATAAAHQAELQRGKLAEFAESWAQTRRPDSDSDSRNFRAKEESRRADPEMERRSRRFLREEEVAVETRNRYEQPESRKRADYQKAGRNRVMRMDEDEDEAHVDKAERKRQRKEAKRKMQEAKGPTPVHLPEYISVANLAGLLKVRLEEFVTKLEELGFEDVQHDHIINAEHAGLVAQEYNFEPILLAGGDDGDLHAAPALSPEDYEKLPARPPVVTIMGHVDHGKTTILDYMRSTSVAAGEFGGITQHIGAFSVPLASGRKITFLDTPGHAAFETMRARGANVTDIVVLVVAADDSVMPQTVEAIKHAQAAQVPIIVAINKIDKSQADPDAVKLDLGRHGIEVEDFGGDVQAIPVSGKTGQGIPDLEEAITTLSETLDHRADPAASVEGWVIEGSTKKAGKVATILVRSGTLRKGDYLVAGNTWTRVRSLKNEAGALIEEVGPGMPVEVDGWREQPIAGDEVLQATDEQHAQSVFEIRQDKLDREQMAIDMEAVNETRRQESERREAEEAAAKAAADGEAAEEVAKKDAGPQIISFIIKGDVSGSVEAVIDSVSALGNGEVGARILRHGVGAPSEFDVQHAADAKGHIVNFNTAIPNHISAMAKREGVQILDSNIIYRVVENVKALLEEKLPPKIVQKVTGEAEVAMLFDIGLGGRKKMTIAGSKVRNGEVKKGSRARVLRKDAVVHDGVIDSLKNQKKDVVEMRKDTECGIGFENGWAEFKVGDKIQCYEEERIKRTL